MGASGNGTMSDTNPDPEMNGARRNNRTRTDTESILRVENLSKRFGGVTALKDVDLEVRDGEIAALVGPNGAGKSTLFNCISGVHEASSGSIHLHDNEITDMSAASIIQQGISRTFQLARVFPRLTVRENLLVHQQHDDERMLSTLYRKSNDDVIELADELIEFVDLEHVINEQAGNLSGGQKKLLNLACTLVPEPAVVLLDEPTAGINPDLVDKIIESILRLNQERSTTFFIIEHDMDVVHEMSDYVYVLANATNLVDDTPNAALNDDRVLKAYFGN